MQEAFEETGALKGVEVMRERVDNEELFKEWLCKQHKQDGNKYSANTISQYCSALSKSPEKLEGIDDDCKRSIFVYDDVGEFSIVHEIIKKAPNFDEVNKAAGNQSFKYGMIKYQEFLQQNSQGGLTMKGSDEKLNEYVDLLKSTKNLILTGAPGTGKTYLARQIAQAMGCSSQEIGFVQFHPSYDYTDFVEGLRPVQDESGNGQIGFERKDGVFKDFCARALKNLQDSRKSESELKSELSLKEKIDAFLLKAKENGDKFYTSKENVFFIKTYNEKKVVVMYKTKDGTISDTVSIKYSDLEKLLKENRKIERSEVKLLTGRAVERQEDSYSSVLINNMLAEPSECIVVKENNIELKNFVFIIDEINRGEVSKIFGELFYSVDPGYRVSAQELEAVRANEKQLATIKTQYANLETDGNDFDRALNSADYGHFFIPENVFIIGTMNDIDRSVESMDFAFRRRFTWVEVKAKDTQDMLDEKLDENGQTQGLPSNLAQEAKERMNRLNKAISKISGLNEAYHIGASYFMKLNEYDGDFEKLWEYHLKGLLHEYLRGSGNEATGMEILEKAYFGEEERFGAKGELTDNGQ